MSKLNKVAAAVVEALNPAQELEAAKAGYYASTEGFTKAQKGQDDSVRRMGLAIGGKYPAFMDYRGDQAGSAKCADWAEIDSLRKELKGRVVEIRVAGGHTKEKASAYFDSTWSTMKLYWTQQVAAATVAMGTPALGTAEDAAKESGGAQSRKLPRDKMAEVVADAYTRLDKVIKDKVSKSCDVEAEPFLHMANLLISGKLIPAGLVDQIKQAVSK